MTKPRPFGLYLTNGQSVTVEAPTLEEAIHKVESAAGARVQGGFAQDGGLARFDPEDDLEQFMAGHRVPAYPTPGSGE